jgi:hypothetical protein
MRLSTFYSLVKVLIADDNAFMRAALSRMVESDNSLSVVGTAQTGPETLTQIDRLQPLRVAFLNPRTFWRSVLEPGCRDDPCGGKTVSRESCEPSVPSQVRTITG